jgi:hypothetical protein
MRARAAVLIAIAAGAGACAPDESSVGAVLDAQPGLKAEYFDGRDLQRPSGVYVDPAVDFTGFELNQTIQARGHVARTLSIRWTGQIWLGRAETYTISFELRGRGRVWIDGAVVIDDWVDDGTLREPSGAFASPGAGWRDLRVEWDQIAGPMDARLSYQSASQPKAVVPPSALRLATAATGMLEEADVEAIAGVPLQAVLGRAASPHGSIVAGVSSEDDLFWDAWVLPPDGSAPRRLAPVGGSLLSVDATGVRWAAAYEIWLSPADGSPAVLVSAEPPAE